MKHHDWTEHPSLEHLKKLDTWVKTHVESF
jgi:hypothetical protein